MKKIIFLFTILLILLNLSCVNTCKLEQDGIDRFTKQRTVVTNKFFIEKKGTKGLAFDVFKDDDGIRLYLTRYSFEVSSISEGARVMFLLDNNEVLTLKAQKSNISTGYKNYQQLKTWLKLTLQDIDKLKKHKVIAYRIYLNDGYVEEDVYGLYQQGLMKLLSCYTSSSSIQ